MEPPAAREGCLQCTIIHPPPLHANRYEHKPGDMLQERVAQTYLTQLTAALTSARAVNKTDVVTLVCGCRCSANASMFSALRPCWIVLDIDAPMLLCHGTAVALSVVDWLSLGCLCGVPYG